MAEVLTLGEGLQNLVLQECYENEENQEEVEDDGNETPETAGSGRRSQDLSAASILAFSLSPTTPSSRTCCQSPSLT